MDSRLLPLPQRLLHRSFLLSLKPRRSSSALPLPHFPPDQSRCSPLPLESSPLVNTTATVETFSMKDAFSKYSDYLNNLNDKRERVIKASRDITMNSKKVIFQVHRISKQNKEEVMQKAEKDLVAVTDQYSSRLVRKLQAKGWFDIAVL